MDKVERLRIEIESEMKVLKDSPGVTVTYADIARVYERLLQVMSSGNGVGFNGNSDAS